MSTGPLKPPPDAGLIPPEEEERLSRWLLDIMDDERKWDAAFDDTVSTLDQLAHDANDNR